MPLTTPYPTFTPYKFRVFLGSAQNTSAAANVRIAFDTRTFDTGSNVDITTTKGRFTAPIAGAYHFSAAFTIAVSGTTQVGISLFKNGSVVSVGATASNTAFSNTIPGTFTVSDTLQLALGDTVDADAFCNGSVPITTGTGNTYFSGFLVSAA